MTLQDIFYEYFMERLESVRPCSDFDWYIIAGDLANMAKQVQNDYDAEIYVYTHNDIAIGGTDADDDYPHEMIEAPDYIYVGINNAPIILDYLNPGTVTKISEKTRKQLNDTINYNPVDKGTNV